MKDDVTDAAVWLPLGKGTLKKSETRSTSAANTADVGERNTQNAQSNLGKPIKTILRKGGQQWQQQATQTKKTV